MVTVFARCFLKELQCVLLVACPRDEAFKTFAFLIDGPPKTMSLALNLHEHLVKIRAPLAPAQAVFL